LFHTIENRQQSGKPQQQHKSRRRLPLLTSAFRKHCSRSFDSGISYLLTDTSHVSQQTSPPTDDVLNEEEEIQHEVSISPTFNYLKHLHTQITKAQKKTDGFTVFFVLFRSGRIKAAHKMLVKLIKCVNVINFQ